MFLADWSGRRVAACAIVWLVGFPVLVNAAVIIGELYPLSGLGGVPRATAAALRAPALDTVWYDSTAGVDTVAARQMLLRDDSSRRLAFLPGQPSDFGGIEVVSAHEVDGGYGLDLLPWLLPPALLVAAWAWTCRSRPEA